MDGMGGDDGWVFEIVWRLVGALMRREIGLRRLGSKTVERRGPVAGLVLAAASAVIVWQSDAEITEPLTRSTSAYHQIRQQFLPYRLEC